MTRRTIHDMTDDDVKEDLRKAFRYVPEHQSITEACTSVARRLAGPDPRPLVEALQRIVDNTILEALMPDLYENARKALAAWEKGQ